MSDSTSEIRRSGELPLVRLDRGDREPGPVEATTSGRRVLVLTLAVLGSAVAGLALAFVEPLLVFGGATALLFVMLVVRKPFVGLVAYTVIFMLRPAELYPALEPLRMERLVGLLTLASLVVSQLSAHGKVLFDSSRQTRLLLAFLVAAVASLPFAFWWAEASQGVIDLLKIFVFYFLVVQLIDTRTKLRVFVWTLVMLVVYQAGISVLDYFRGSILYAQGIERAVGRTGGMGANELGASMAATIPVFLLFLMRKDMGRWRIFFAICLALLLITLAVTGSRSALLGFLASCAFVWWRARHRVLFALLGLTMLVGGFFLLPDQYQERYSTITEGDLDDSSSLRIVIWKAGLRMIVDRPLTGVGISCYGIANGMEYSPPDRRNWMEAHSLYVQVPAETGLIGAIAFFWFLFELIHLNRRTARALGEEEEDWEFERTLLNALCAGIIALMVTGVFGHSLLRRTWYVYGALGLVTLRLYVDWARVRGRAAISDRLVR